MYHNQVWTFLTKRHLRTDKPDSNTAMKSNPQRRRHPLSQIFMEAL